MRLIETFKSGRRESGVALILALLLLVVLTVLGVGTMSSVSMQERMASNANLQALAFKGASAGVTETLEFWLNEANWPIDPLTNVRATCVRDGGNWITGWRPANGSVLTVPDLPPGFEVRYRTRLGCFEDPAWAMLTGSTEPPPVNLLALSEGRVVRTSDGRSIALREIEVRLEDRIGEADCLLQFGGLQPPPALRLPTSNFDVDASPGGCAMQASTQGDTAELLAEMVAKNNTIDNYRPSPPVRTRPPRGAWGDAELLAGAANGIKIGLRAYRAWQTSGPGGANPFQACAGTLILGDSGSCPSGGITYISGDLTASGTCTAAGTMIVEGKWMTNGTPSYAGNVLILGGEVDVRGFGNAPNAGLFIVQNLVSPLPGTFRANRAAYDPETVAFGLSKFNVKGGGSASIRPQPCPQMQASWRDLNRCLVDLRGLVDREYAPGISEFEHFASLAGLGGTTLDIPQLQREGGDPDAVPYGDTIVFPIPDCDGSGSGRQLAIVSWREFIDAGRWDSPRVLP
jgi:hypothetical protein